MSENSNQAMPNQGLDVLRNSKVTKGVSAGQNCHLSRDEALELSWMPFPCPVESAAPFPEPCKSAFCSLV